MATTQQDKPKNGGKNAVVLKPLNLNTLKPRVRRTSTQVLASRVQKQLNLAEKAQQRADNLAARQQRALERAQEAQQAAQAAQDEAERKQREAQERDAAQAAERAGIQAGERSRSGSTTVPVIEKTPQIDKMLKELTKDFRKFFDHVQEKHGVTIDFFGGEPELVKRGYISMKMRGEMSPQTKVIAEPAPSDTGVAREAVRFMLNCKQIGLTAAWLNKEVKLKGDDHTYRLTGLRGKANSIVLRRVDNGMGFTMNAADFKKALA